MLRSSQVFHLKCFPDARGELYVLENGERFPIRRVFWIRQVPFDATRGNHAAIHDNELLVLTAGKCKVDIHDGKVMQTFCLEEPMDALLIPKMTWRKLYAFSSDCTLTVLADQPYVSGNTIQEFDAFLAAVNHSKI